MSKIKPPSYGINSLTNILHSPSLKAGLFASCPVLKIKLDAIFIGQLGAMFYALPLPRKQIVSAVLSAPKIDARHNPKLVSNLMGCNDTFLLKNRFSSQVDDLVKLLNKLTPSL